jgi:preprotein translocase subunit SecG
MEILIIILKVVIAISLLNVWLVQYKKPTQWRGGDAQNILEEFKVYGLPVWLCYVVGFLKVTLAILLVVSIWVPVLQDPAAIGLGALLTGSIIMHIKISDPLKKSFPAALFLGMCLCIVFL